jgi:hypothetical protein
LPNWKRLIVGDAFASPSRDLNFYRDLFLTVPFLLFALAAIGSLFAPTHDYRLAIKSAGSSLLALALARERFVLISGSLGFVCVECLGTFLLRHDLIALVVSIATGALFLVVIRSLKGYKPSYSTARGGTIATSVIALVSLGFTIAIFHYWLAP